MDEQPEQMGVLDLLGQEKFWYSRRGTYLVPQSLDDMDSTHLANLRAWLLRNAGPLHSAALSALNGMASFVSAEMASADLDSSISEIEEMSPQQWMETQPLFEAITDRLGDRLDETHGV
jgi:hypothetical protein